MTLSGNALTGWLPQGMQNLHSLWIFNASNNLLSGHLSLENSRANFLTVDIASNQFSGTLPLLQGVGLADIVIFTANRLSGTIPAGLFQWESVTQVHCSGNMLEGTLPPVTTWAEFLQSVGFAGRPTASWRLLTGTVPQGLSRAQHLVGLMAQHNR